jgi:hypothetical protein
MSLKPNQKRCNEKHGHKWMRHNCERLPLGAGLVAATTGCGLQPDAATSGSGYNWVRLQMAAATTGCGFNWVRLQVDAANWVLLQSGTGYNWLLLQLGAGYNWVRATIGCGLQLGAGYNSVRATTRWGLQLDAVKIGCGNKWMRLQMDAATNGCDYKWVRYNGLRPQLGAALFHNSVRVKDKGKQFFMICDI